jgi:hypothetical protein
MIPAAAEQRPWSGRRWGWAIASVLAAQLGLVFWLGERGPIHARPPAPGPTLRLAGSPSDPWPALLHPTPSALEAQTRYAKALQEWLALTDPTLFALPRREGFSGQASRNLPLQQVRPLKWSAVPEWLRVPEWTEEENWLRLPLAQLGTHSNRPAGTNLPMFTQLCALTQPDMALPDLPPWVLPPRRSQLRIEGELARRRLLVAPALRSWPYTDLLTNSLVRMAVRPEGTPEFFTLLLSGSGLKEADEYALSLARAVRFEPMAGSGPGTEPAPTPLPQLTWGNLVFEWHTVPPTPATNAPPIK